MPTREEIKKKLASARETLLSRYRSMSDEELARPCTESQDGGQPWSAKDHLAHLAMIEQAFQGMIERHLTGASNPVGLGGGSMADVMARVHHGNERNVDEHRGDDLETLIKGLDEARAASLALLDRLTDDQLAEPLPGAPWDDGTIGGVILTNAHHDRQHLAWAEEGLASPAG